MGELPERCDVLVVGAGPAGLGAAAALAAGGAGAVHVLDREPATGGIPRHCGHSPFGMREFRRVMSGRSYARALTHQALAAGAEVHADATVTALRPGGTIELTTPAGLRKVAARAVLLATGARESSRAARMIGGTRQGGVFNTGALQGLVYLAGERPFRRPVVLGTELVAFSALLTCRHAGARPVAMIEPGARTVARNPARLLPLLLGTPLHLRTELLAIYGETWVEGVTLEHCGRRLELEADGVVLTGGFRPENALLRSSHIVIDGRTGGPEIDQYGRCSDPAYFAAGNLLRAVETAGWCWAEGRAVAAAILRGLRGDLPAGEARRVAREGEALAWALPQRLAADTAPPAFDRIQLRVTRPVSGRLGLDEREARISARPERRVTVPLDTGATRLTLREDA